MGDQPYSPPDLNPEQQRAATANGHLMVSACPGSGKTRLLAARAAHLLTSTPEGLLVAVSFTRDASLELQSRILANVGAGYKNRLFTGTFHSAARAQLIRHYGRENIQVISEGVQQQLLRRAWAACNTRMEFETASELIDAHRASIEPEPLAGDVAEIMARYNTLLQGENVHDFQELLLRVVREMASGAMTPIPARWLLVDETQDMDEIQYAWIKAHSKNGADVTIVGDDDQSIFEWRQALGHKGMEQFRDEHRAQHITLSRNYRCGKKILATSAKLIGHNKLRVDKPIRAECHHDGAVEVYRFGTRDDEAMGIVKVLGDSAGTGNWAILTRASWLLKQLQSKFIAHKIKFYRRSVSSMWEDSSVVAILSMLDGLSTDRWTGVANALHACKIDAALLNDIHPISTRASEALPAAANEIKKHAERLGKDRIDPLLKLCKHYPTWKKMGVTEPDLAIAHVNDWLQKYMPEHNAKLTDSLVTDILKPLPGSITEKLKKLERARKVEHENEGVGLLTIHAAKGLEFDNVWLIGMEQGVLPSSKSLPEEERRIAYVAFTRARNRLCLSHTLKKRTPSVFFSDAGIDPLSGYR